ncbi:MAG: heme oxygenase [Candidatus Melainabacteria bacterium HGW-Melainabacteria-1]|nr:MAG: heme oxygenase [Candidatus Melainabacteria bacterium HGW-Melainabacteria-1]
MGALRTESRRDYEPPAGGQRMSDQAQPQTPMQQLKTATAPLHAELEQAAGSDRIMAPDLSRAEFCTFMLGQYTLHQLLEPALANALSHHLPELAYSSQRRKLPLLLQDLRDLGVDTADLGFSPALRLHLPKLDTLAAALGVAYVLEGSTLGAQMIRRRLQNHPELAGRCRFAYYHCYGEQLRTRWLSFGESVNQHLQTPAEIATACQAARDTFSLACVLFARNRETRALSTSKRQGVRA